MLLGELLNKEGMCSAWPVRQVPTCRVMVLSHPKGTIYIDFYEVTLQRGFGLLEGLGTGTGLWQPGPSWADFKAPSGTQISVHVGRFSPNYRTCYFSSFL
jgi:hypothetical protein